MNVLKTLKSLVTGFKKGGDSVDAISDLSKIDSTQSPIMREKTREWWNIFQGIFPQEKTHKNFKPLPTAYVSTAYLAQLVTGEIKFELPDERLNSFVQKNLLPRLDRIVQLTLVGGYTVVKPYITRSGEIFFDVGTSRDFMPITLDENGQITEGIFFERVRHEGKIYERREWHCFHDGLHTVRNSAYIYGTRERVELSSIPRWAGLSGHGEITSNIPMVATLRTPYANNIDLDSALPVSLFANSVGTLHEIDAAHSEYIAEFKKMRAKVFADETVLQGKNGITDDYFVKIEGDGTSTMEQQIMTYAPQIREEAHKAAINTELRLYEVQIGVSCGTFTFDSAKGLVTATQVLSEDRTTFNTVAQLQRQLRPVLEAVAEITANLARFYGFDVVDGKPAIEFGDSVFEDTGTEFSRRFQMVQAGLLKPEQNAFKNAQITLTNSGSGGIIKENEKISVKRDDVSKILDVMPDDDREAFVKLLNGSSNENIKRAYTKYADKIDNVQYTGQDGKAYYQPGSNTLVYSFPPDNNIKKGQTKFETVCHEYGHFIDARGIFSEISYNEIETLNGSLGTARNFFKAVPSSSDKFLKALRSDKERLSKLVLNSEVRTDLFSTYASAGVQDALDGMFGSKVKMHWQHGDAYYNRKYSSIKKFELEKVVQKAYKELGFDVSSQAKVKELVRNYETASEMWANIMSAETCGGKALDYVKKYLPNSYEAYLEIMKGLN